VPTVVVVVFSLIVLLFSRIVRSPGYLAVPDGPRSEFTGYHLARGEDVEDRGGRKEQPRQYRPHRTTASEPPQHSGQSKSPSK